MPLSLGNEETFPSDISREQFETIPELLESARKKTRPRRMDLYEVFCALLYVLKSGCQWRMLPSDFPIWNAKSSERELSLLEQALKKQVGVVRINHGRNEKATFCIVDA